MSLAPFVTVCVTVSGPVDEPTGYIADVKLLDRLVREASLTLLAAASSDGSSTVTLAQDLFGQVSELLPDAVELQRLEMRPTPYQSLSVRKPNVNTTILTHQFEFSAAHRLHCESLSDDENRRLFGKCNNPNGHGHNYVLEVSVECQSAEPFDLHAFESTVREHAVSPFDHKHLNIDVQDFTNLNPTVENIASVIWDRLAQHVESLHSVRVYETPKTWAEVVSR